MQPFQTIPRITVRKDGPVGFAQFLRDAKPFDTNGHLRARREFQGFGSYVPYDQNEVDEIMSSLYFVYSYDTPIAYLTKHGVWIKNLSRYSATTSTHQSLIHSAINLIR